MSLGGCRVGFALQATAGEEAGENPARSRHCDPGTSRGARHSSRRHLHPGRGPRRKATVERAAVPVLRRRRARRPAAGAHRQCRFTRRRRGARPRGEGHGQVDRGAGARGAVACGRGRRGLPVLLRARRHRLPRWRRARACRAPAGAACRAAGRRLRGSPGRLARPRAGADDGGERLRARAARGGAPRGALRRRGQPAARPPRRSTARRGRPRDVLRRAGRRVGPARGAVPAGRHDEPGGGRVAAAAARPVRTDGRGRGDPRTGRTGRRRPPPAGLRGRPGRLRRGVRRAGRRAGSKDHLGPGAAAGRRAG